MAWIYNITDSLSSLTTAQKENNANEFRNKMASYGWSLKAICGALGNIQYEGLINPGQCENGYGVPQSPTDVWYLGGLGLIGWTGGYGQWPNAIITYAIDTGGDWWDGDLQCEFLTKGDDYDANHGYWMWIPRGPWTAVDSIAEYSQWAGSVADAAACFCYNAEYPADIENVIPDRQTAAEYWYDYFNGGPEPPPPTPPTPDPPTPGWLTLDKMGIILTLKRKKLRKPDIRRR